MDEWLNKVNWSREGLIAAIAQEAESGRVLMLAWMNRDALMRTASTGEAHYWSRSRNKIWRKGEESGHTQKIKSIRLDCDDDAILLEVEQIEGIACHTGRHSCFFQQLQAGQWVVTDAVLKERQDVHAE